MAQSIPTESEHIEDIVVGVQHKQGAGVLLLQLITLSGF